MVFPSLGFPHTRLLIPTTTAASDQMRSDMLPSPPPFGRVHRLGMQLRIFDFNFQWKSAENTPWRRLRRRPRSASRPVGGGSLSRFPLKIEISKVAEAIFPNSSGSPGGPLPPPLIPPGWGRDAFYQVLPRKHGIASGLWSRPCPSGSVACCSSLLPGAPRSPHAALRRSQVLAGLEPYSVS